MSSVPPSHAQSMNANPAARPLVVHLHEEHNLARLVRRLASELANVQTRLVRIEAQAEELRSAWAHERRHVVSNEMSIDQLLLPRQPSDLGASWSSSSSEPESATDHHQGHQESVEGNTSTAARGRRGCSVDGCRALCQRRGTCRRHDPSRCSEPGCETRPYRGAKCQRHGAKRLCSESGCVNFAFSTAKCRRHGGRRPCSEPGCSYVSVRGGRCRRHGGADPCEVEGCAKVSRRGGRCHRHLHSNAVDTADA